MTSIADIRRRLAAVVRSEPVPCRAVWFDMAGRDPAEAEAEIARLKADPAAHVVVWRMLTDEEAESPPPA